MRPLKLLDCWFALNLTVGIGAQLVLSAAVGVTAAFAAGSGASFAGTLVLVAVRPDVDTGPLWRAGLTAFAVALVIKAAAVGLDGGRPVTGRVAYAAGIAAAVAAEGWRWRTAD